MRPGQAILTAGTSTYDPAVLQDSLLELVLLLMLWCCLLAAGLAALFVVVRAAVEQGIRRALPDAALRPHVREVLRQQEAGGRAAPRPGPPPA